MEKGTEHNGQIRDSGPAGKEHPNLGTTGEDSIAGLADRLITLINGTNDSYPGEFHQTVLKLDTALQNYGR